MIDYKIYCPSYRRGQLAISHKIFNKDKFIYVIRESEKQNYAHLDNEKLFIPEGAVKDIATTRNWILKNKKSEFVVMVDDDMSYIAWTLKREIKKLSPSDIHSMIQNSFQMSIDCGAGYWGMNILNDPKAYRICAPFSFSRVVLGPFMGILDTSILFDENLPLKEDYDFFLQQLNKHRKVLRFNMLSYSVDHQKMAGGCQTYRNAEFEQDQNLALIKKWGSDIISQNTTNPGSINMIVRTGI